MSKARSLNEIIWTYISPKKIQPAYHSSVFLNDKHHGNMAEIFSSRNVLSVSLNLTVTTAPGKKKSSPSGQITDWRKEGGMSPSLFGSTKRNPLLIPP